MKKFIQKILTICLLYVNTVMLTYSVQHAYNHESTHVFYARLYIFMPIAIVTFVIGTYLLIRLTKRVTYNIKKEIETSRYKERLAEKHSKFQQMINNSYMLEADKVNAHHYIYSEDGKLLGYIIEEGCVIVK